MLLPILPKHGRPSPGRILWIARLPTLVTKRVEFLTGLFRQCPDALQFTVGGCFRTLRPKNGACKGTGDYVPAEDTIQCPFQQIGLYTRKLPRMVTSYPKPNS